MSEWQDIECLIYYRTYVQKAGCDVDKYIEFKTNAIKINLKSSLSIVGVNCESNQRLYLRY